MIAWCGSGSDGLGWLSERCGSLDELRQFDTLTIEAVDAACSQHPRRLILAVENRHDYPLETIQYLQRAWSEVPFAIALGSWFDGSRRTGIGATSHLCLPWYRWWDGWFSWLSSSSSSQNLSAESLSPETEHSASGIIICDCQQTAAGWREALGTNSAVQMMTAAAFQKWLRQVGAIEQSPSDENASELSWILWDDTCLNTFIGSECLGGVCSLFTRIRDQFPNIAILAAASAPRWDEWQQWSASGADELIAKPSCRISLHEILSSSKILLNIVNSPAA